MITKKTSCLIILAMLSVLFGVLIKNTLVTLVSIPLFSYVIFSLVFLSVRVHVNLGVRRSLSRDSIYEDQKVSVMLEIQNRGTSKLDCVEIFDISPKGLRVSNGSNRRIVEISPHEKFSFTYNLTPKSYGYYEIGPTKIRVSDSQSTFSREMIFSEDITHLRVFPKIEYVPKISIRPRRTRNWLGETSARKPGAGAQFYSLREYQEGDPTNRINWKASSKTPTEVSLDSSITRNCFSSGIIDKLSK